MFTDYDNLRSITKLLKLNPRQAYYIIILAPFNFKVYYKLGNKNPTNILLYRSDYILDNKRYVNKLLLILLKRLLVYN